MWGCASVPSPDLFPPVEYARTEAGEIRTVTRQQMQSYWKIAGGWVSGDERYPLLSGETFLPVTQAWMFRALQAYHTYQKVLTGMPPQMLANDKTYNCIDRARGFVAFVTLVHRLSRSSETGRLAIGWAATPTISTRYWTLKDHAVVVALVQEASGSLHMVLWEPMFESVHARYPQKHHPFQRAYLCIF